MNSLKVEITRNIKPNPYTPDDIFIQSEENEKKN